MLYFVIHVICKNVFIALNFIYLILIHSNFKDFICLPKATGHGNYAHSFNVSNNAIFVLYTVYINLVETDS